MIIVNNFLSILRYLLYLVGYGILLYILSTSSIFKMLVKTFENIGKNNSKNIVKVNLKQDNNLYCIIIWSTYVQRKHIFDKTAR